MNVDTPVRPTSRAGGLFTSVLVAGIVFDVGLRGGPTNLVVVFGIGIVLLAVAVHGRVEQVEARWLLLVAAVPAVFLAVRSSPWLAASNLLAVAGLGAAAAMHARSGSVLDTTPLRLVRRMAVVAAQAVCTPVLVRPLVKLPGGSRGRDLMRVARAGLVAGPPLVVVMLLLASADAVFAGLLFPDIDGGPLVGHVVLVAVLSFAVLATIVAATADPDDGGPRPGGYGVIEVTTMLGLAAAVLGLFVVSQLIAATGAGRRLVESAGLTPAQYARSGFFQLCFATAVLLVFLGVVRGLAAPGVLQTRAVRTLAAVVPILATGLVVVSLRRMAVYDDAFGLTMLRLWVVGASVWMGALLAMLALRNAGVGEDRNWLVAGAGAVALTLVVLADLLNPEAVVVRHNVERGFHGAELDTGYLARLSDDAVPALLDAARRAADEPTRNLLLAAVGCGEDAGGVAALNVAAQQAGNARDQICPPG